MTVTFFFINISKAAFENEALILGNKRSLDVKSVTDLSLQSVANSPAFIIVIVIIKLFLISNTYFTVT